MSCCLPQPLDVWQLQATLQSQRTASFKLLCACIKQPVQPFTPSRIIRLRAKYACMTPTNAVGNQTLPTLTCTRATKFTSTSSMPENAFEARPLTRPSGQPLEQLPANSCRGAHDLAAKDSIDNTAQAPFPLDMGPCWSAQKRWVCVPGDISSRQGSALTSATAVSPGSMPYGLSCLSRTSPQAAASLCIPKAKAISRWAADLPIAASGTFGHPHQVSQHKRYPPG